MKSKELSEEHVNILIDFAQRLINSQKQNDMDVDINAIIFGNETKKTIFDLKEPELEELLLIAMGDDRFIKIRTIEILYHNKYIEFLIVEDYDERLYNIELTIDLIHDFVLTIHGNISKINNQRFLHRRLQEMLNNKME